MFHATGPMEACLYGCSDVAAASNAGYHPCCLMLVASCPRRRLAPRESIIRASGVGGGVCDAPVPCVRI